MNAAAPHADALPPGARRPDWPFFGAMGVFGGVYVAFILAVLYAIASFTGWSDIIAAVRSPEILFAIRLSLVSCTLTALLSLWVAVPAGYLLARHTFPGRRIVDAILDIPIILPPLVIGLGLLILFQTPVFQVLQRAVPVTYTANAVVLAQFVVACAFSVRTMMVTFEQINPRTEWVALTLGCSRAQAFWQIVLPQARRGILTAATLAWARSLGEFGPILVFAGATRMRTEVLPTTVFLELSIGNIEAAAAVSLIMIVAALAVLALARIFGLGTASEGVL